MCIGGYAPGGVAAESTAQVPEEDGYKLWLRYAPPGDAAKSYRKVVRQIRVDGTSATSGIIRDELRSGYQRAMLGGAVPLNENGLVDGTIIVGTPGNSSLVRDLNWAAELACRRRRRIHHPLGAHRKQIR